MEAFGVQFQICDERRFADLVSLWAEIKRDMDAGTFRGAHEWAPLVPAGVKGLFRWPTEEERSCWQAVRDSTVTEIANPNEQLGTQWDFDRVFESIEEGDYAVMGCERVDDFVGELQINPNGYPYGGVGPLIALAEAFGFLVLGVNECGRFESRAELLGRPGLG